MSLRNAVSAAIEKASHFARFDSWQNLVTGLGGLADKRMWAKFSRRPLLSSEELAALYHGEWLAALIVNLLPETAMAKGYELQVPDGEEIETRVASRMSELGAWDALFQAAIWGRTFGAGAVFMGIVDGGRVEQPVRYEAIQRVAFVDVLDVRDMWIAEWFDDPNEPRFGQAKVVAIRRRAPGGKFIGDIRVHADRLLLFPGALTASYEKLANQGWDYSILQRIYDVLRDWGIGWAGASTLLQEASQAVYKVKNLTKILASEGGEEEIQKRFRMIEMSRSIAKALLIDGDGEEFERKATSFAGVPDLLDRFANQLAAATRIPVTILMGQAPAGLSATGESDLRTWEMECQKWQTHVLLPRLERLVRALLVEGAAVEPESWTLSFAPIATETPKGKAELRKLVAETDAIYMQWGVALPEEIAQSRFAREGWSPETQIDLELRAELGELKEEQLLEQAEAGGDKQNAGTVGAQVEALATIVEQVKSGALEYDAAVAQVVALFGQTEEQARALLGDIEENSDVIDPNQGPIPGGAGATPTPGAPTGAGAAPVPEGGDPVL